jgi:PqqD family protein of HPr-rel-A system
MDTAMQARWAAMPGADLAWRLLDEGCVVHHALTNDTHVLAAWIAPLLEALSRPGEHSTEALARCVDEAPDEVAAVLAELAALRLIRPC